MSEARRIAISDKDGNNALLSVVQSVADPTKNGIVILNANWTPIWSTLTLSQVWTNSTTTALSLYQMTSAQDVEFRASDASTLLYLDETNKRIGIGTNAPSDSLSLSGNSATRIGTTWLNTNSSPATSAFLGAYSGNMQMGTVSNHPFYLETNNTVRISIAAAGNIGIGLNSGSAKLHVLATTEQLRLGYDSSNYASFTVTSGGLLNIAPTGTNVGINVASPSSPLHVNGAIRSQRTGTATQNIVLDGGDSGAIYLTASSTTGGQKILRFRNLVTGGAATDATNQFGWDLNTDSSILQIATLSFGSGFKVNRSNTTTQFLSVNGGDSSGIYLTGQSATSAEKILYISNFTNGTATSANGISFRVGDVGAPVTAGVINYLGNWGIGTTSPNYKLHLSNTADADISGTTVDISNLSAYFSNPTNTNGLGVGIGFAVTADTSSVGAAIVHERVGSSSQGKLHFATKSDTVSGTDLTYGMTLDSNGNFGIGKTSPTAVLHLKAGTATASTAPLKFTSGTLLTTPEAGTFEYDGKNLFFTPQAIRHVVSLASDAITADTTVANTTTETTIYSVAIPANSLSAGKMLDFKANGYFSTANASDTLTVRFKIGATTIASAVFNPKTVTDAGFMSNGKVTIRTIGAGGTLQGFLAIQDEISSAIGVNTSTTAIDTTTSNTFSVTVQWSVADAGNTLTVQQSLVEFLNGV